MFAVSVRNSIAMRKSTEETFLHQVRISILNPPFHHSFSEFQLLKKTHDDHLQRVKVERQFYNNSREESRRTTSTHTAPASWASIEGTQHISIDTMKQLAIPTFGSRDQPKDTFYHPNLSVTPMGVFAEGTGESVIY